jgi:hypothetical protein
LENIGRSLQPGETLKDVAYKAILEWNTRKDTFQKIHFKIKYETLKDRSNSMGRMPDNIGNDSEVFNYFIPSEQGPTLILDGHGKQLGFRCSIPLDLVEGLEDTAPVLPPRKAEDSKLGKFVKRHYAVWGDCMGHIQPSSEYTKELPHSQAWLDANKTL